MVRLFLSEPNWDDDRDSQSVKKIMSDLSNLESLVWSLIISGGRSEAKLWLCNAISGITSITSFQKQELFVTLLKSKPKNRRLASQLLQMMIEQKPYKLGLIIAKKSYMLDKFFEGNPTRILQWFSSFDNSGGVEHKKGARALAQFAFQNRDICWEELEWKGKHGQSPVMVATKPYYFLDLDVQQTIENFIDNVPEFWSSNEFADSLRDGEVLLIDTNFFLELFIDLMYEEDSKAIWKAVNEFLLEVSFSSLCHHLLMTLEEQDFCFFLDLLSKSLNTRTRAENLGSSSNWLEILLLKWKDFKSMDQLLLLNALINQGRKLLKLVHDEESHDEQTKIKGTLSHLLPTLSDSDGLALVLKECLKLRDTEAIKLTGLLSWFLHFSLSEKCQAPESWESLFKTNAISFRKHEKYQLLSHDRVSEEGDPDELHNTSTRRCKKKGSSRKKRRRKFLDDDSYENELLDFGTSDTDQSLHFRSNSWLLSTDGFSVPWTSADLPEHLSKHCFSTWMKWVFIERNKRSIC